MRKSKAMLSGILLLLGVILTSCNTQTAAPSTSQQTNPASTATAQPAEPSKEPQILRLNVEEPSSLDTALAETANAGILIRELFDGLTRFDENGNAAKSLATDINISPDQLTYTFKLREAKWTNGDPVTADDFAFSWMRMLDPKTASPNAYRYWDIKNGKAYNTGKAKAEDVGIKVVDPQTLQVTLEHPTPYFVNFSPFFSPVHRKSVEADPQNWWKDPSKIVTNGPFKLESWDHKNKMVMAKNDTYWDKDSVKLDKIEFSMIADSNTELELFNSGELDWAGAPLGSLPAAAIPSLKENGQLKSKPKAGINYIEFNVEKPPFTNEKIRRAFSYALNRKDITENITQSGETPLLGFVPQSMALKPEGYFKDNDVELAKQMLSEGMKELGVTQLPPVSFAYNTSDLNKQVAEAMQAQWKQALGIDVKLENAETNVFLQNQDLGKYQFSRSGWVADYNDPVNFLEKFVSKDSSSNATRWFNPKYSDLINKARTEMDDTKRKQMYTEAETILMTEMNVSPVFTRVNAWVQSDKVKGVIVDSLGYIDFKYAYKE